MALLTQQLNVPFPCHEALRFNDRDYMVYCQRIDGNLLSAYFAMATTLLDKLFLYPHQSLSSIPVYVIVLATSLHAEVRYIDVNIQDG